MKIVNFKNSVIALAIGLIMASCGGGSSNKQSGSSTKETSKKESTAMMSRDELKKLHKEVEMPKIDFIEDWMLPKDGILTEAKQDGGTQWSFTVEGIYKVQYDNYLKTLESKAQKKASASDEVFSYNGVDISIMIPKFKFKDDGNDYLYIYIIK
jgi:hypothetical protein